MKTLLPFLLLCLTLTTPGWAVDYWKLSNDTQPLPSNLSWAADPLDMRCTHNSEPCWLDKKEPLAHLPMSPSIQPQMDINGALILTPKQMAELKEAMRKDDGSTLRGTLFDDPCLAILQEAHAVMDRFVQGLIISTDRARTVWQPGAQQQFNAAKVQWDAAKGCWRETK